MYSEILCSHFLHKLSNDVEIQNQWLVHFFSTISSNFIGCTDCPFACQSLYCHQCKCLNSHAFSNHYLWWQRSWNALPMQLLWAKVYGASPYLYGYNTIHKTIISSAWNKSIKCFIICSQTEYRDLAYRFFFYLHSWCWFVFKHTISTNVHHGEPTNIFHTMRCCQHMLRIYQYPSTLVNACCDCLDVNHIWKATRRSLAATLYTIKKLDLTKQGTEEI